MEFINHNVFGNKVCKNIGYNTDMYTHLIQTCNLYTSMFARLYFHYINYKIFLVENRSLKGSKSSVADPRLSPTNGTNPPPPPPTQ